ncbi:hypothetical protein [Dyadobacter sp. CY323]|uniref:hypothetical protein n=1 Tax=Dyadobacter sp. CY323 TaxID=2907302 RepID=UPI001F1AE360|nr:hypothetical protein [Dyadobacter sp. CY323]MCE6989588.1 hypothetical protein [Dyadobacter sp. CY323]
MLNPPNGRIFLPELSGHYTFLASHHPGHLHSRTPIRSHSLVLFFFQRADRSTSGKFSIDRCYYVRTLFPELVLWKQLE